MKQFFALAVLLVTVMISSIANVQVEEVVVIGHMPGPGIVGGLTPPPAASTQGSILYSPGAFAAKSKAEAYGACLNNAYQANASCYIAASNNLVSNQGVCTKVGVSMAGVTAGVGILIFLTGVGSVPGAAITGAAGATGTMLYNQCNNVAQNISLNSKTSCDSILNQTKVQCEAIKP